MKVDTPLPTIGTPMPGGFFAGVFRVNGQRRALIASSKAVGEMKQEWIKNYKNVPDAISFNDGMANTLAMAKAGSELAKRMTSLSIDGLNDFYIPSQDELEILYRAFKPTSDSNSLYARSGMNVSADVPTYPYTSEMPAQTSLSGFQEGGTEAFDADWYWSSTQHAGYSDYAWFQSFTNGDQYDYSKGNELRVRAVRSQPI